VEYVFVVWYSVKHRENFYLLVCLNFFRSLPVSTTNNDFKTVKEIFTFSDEFQESNIHSINTTWLALHSLSAQPTKLWI
jgi:hypothetical protein